MQSSAAYQGWKKINDRARVDNSTQDTKYGDAKIADEKAGNVKSYEESIYARRKTVPKLLWKTNAPVS